MIFGKRAWWYSVAEPKLFNREDIIWIDLAPKCRGWHWVQAAREDAILVEKLTFVEVWKLKLQSFFRRRRQ